MRGRTLLRLGALLAALFLLLPLVRGTAPRLTPVLGAAVILGAGAVVRGRWWVFRIERHQLEEALARSCRMARAAPAASTRGVGVQLARAELMIAIHPRGSRVFELRFDGPWHAHTKAVLVRSVIAKQFEPPVPRIRIRLRRAR